MKLEFSCLQMWGGRGQGQLAAVQFLLAMPVLLAAWWNSAFPFHFKPCSTTISIWVTVWHTTWGNCSGCKTEQLLGYFSFGSVSLLVERAGRLFAIWAKLQPQKHQLIQGLLWKILFNCNLIGSMCCRWKRLNFCFS